MARRTRAASRLGRPVAPRSPPRPEIPMRTPATPTVLLPLAVATLGILAGCADAPTAASRGAELRVSRAAGAAVERPWTGRCDVETVATEFGSTGPTRFHQEGTCQLAHLGRTTVETEETVVPGMIPRTIAVTSTFIAANGDRLYTTGIVRGSAVAPDGSVTIAGTYTAVGGTGRFAGASGTAAFAETARINPPAPTVGTYTLEGWLAY